MGNLRLIRKFQQSQQPLQQFAPPPGQNPSGGPPSAENAGYPGSFPGTASHGGGGGGQREGGPPNHMVSPPVSVTGGTNQIQVIKFSNPILKYNSSTIKIRKFINVLFR